MREAQLPNGPRLLAGYLEPRWIERANVAKFWRTTPLSLKGLPEVEYQRMREYTMRSIEADRAAVEAAKLGAKTPGRSGIKPGDQVVERKRGQRDIDDI